MYFPTLFLIDISQVRLSELFIRFYDGQNQCQGRASREGHTPGTTPNSLSYPLERLICWEDKVLTYLGFIFQ